MKFFSFTEGVCPPRAVFHTITTAAVSNQMDVTLHSEFCSFLWKHIRSVSWDGSIRFMSIRSYLYVFPTLAAAFFHYFFFLFSEIFCYSRTANLSSSSILFFHLHLGLSYILLVAIPFHPSSMPYKIQAKT